MRKKAVRKNVAVVGLIVLLAVPATAQDPPKQGLPKTASLSYAVEHGWLRLNVVSGRIECTLDSNRTSAGTTPGVGAERIAIQTVRGRHAFSYELSNPQERFFVKITCGGWIHIRRIPEGNSGFMAVEFIQEPDRPVSLYLGLESDRRDYKAASLWHLLIAQRRECRQYLVPLLEMLRPDWGLMATADQLEKELLATTAPMALTEQQRLAVLVEQLGDDKFARREAADRQLQATGRAVVAYLQRLDPGRLDVEQQFRVRRIIWVMSGNTAEDATRQTATGLAGDPAIWLALLSHPKESTRRLAVEHLGSLLGGPIDFDPVADPHTRQRRIENLRARISNGE